MQGGDDDGGEDGDGAEGEGGERGRMWWLKRIWGGALRTDRRRGLGFGGGCFKYSI